jgi:chorismate synthase
VFLTLVPLHLPMMAAISQSQFQLQHHGDGIGSSIEVFKKALPYGVGTLV